MKCRFWTKYCNMISDYKFSEFFFSQLCMRGFWNDTISDPKCYLHDILANAFSLKADENNRWIFAKLEWGDIVIFYINTILLEKISEKRSKNFETLTYFHFLSFSGSSDLGCKRNNTTCFESLFNLTSDSLQWFLYIPYSIRIIHNSEV